MSKNDITGDDIKSRVSTEAFRNQFDTIFGKKKEWVSLTDEEIYENVENANSVLILDIIRAVEAKLKEKNSAT